MNNSPNFFMLATVAVAAALAYQQRPEEMRGRPAAGSSVHRDRGSRGSSSDLSVSLSRDLGQHLAVPGIKNLGNTCFLNAVLQSLGSFPIFREYLEALSRPLIPKGLVFNSNETPFAQELLELMNKLKPRIPTPPLTPISPTKLNAILRERVDIFGKHDQQDAQELFQMVMRLLGEEAALCLKNRDKRTGAFQSGGTGGLLGLVDSTPKSGSGDNMSKEIPENPLLGSLMYLRHCRGCQEKSGRIERFVDLSLTLPEARNHHVLAHGPVNLEKILEDFTQQQLVEDVECPKCAMRSAMEANDTQAHEEEDEEEEEEEEVVVPLKRVRADMRMLLATPPKTLCLHFPRRHQSPSGSEMKLKQRVVFPVHLNVAPFCYTGGCHTESIGMSKAFQMKSSFASSLPQLPPGRISKTPARAGGLSEAFLQTPASTSSPALAKALQSPQPHPGMKQALVGGSVEGASSSAVGRKELNGLPNGGSRAGGSSVSESVEGRDSMDGGSVPGQDGGMDYDLRAVIVHRGGADSGHYTAFRKLESNHEEAMEAPAGLARKAPRGRGEGESGEHGAGKEEWVYISDEDVETVSEKKVLSSEAYMLFYRQRISDVFNQGLT